MSSPSVRYSLAMRLGQKSGRFDHVVVVRRSHPEQHSSFSMMGGHPHCIPGTPGHALHPSISVPENAIVVDTGQDLADSGHDAFHQTGLGERLLELDVARVVVAGVSTEQAIRATALGSIRESFETWVLVDAIAGLDPSSTSAGRALLEMRHAGVELATAGQMTTILRFQRRVSCLVLTGLQVDFGPGGSVPVEGSLRVFHTVSELLHPQSRH